jgi:hypothetical protein
MIEPIAETPDSSSCSYASPMKEHLETTLANSSRSGLSLDAKEFAYTGDSSKL